MSNSGAARVRETSKLSMTCVGNGSGNDICHDEVTMEPLALPRFRRGRLLECVANERIETHYQYLIRQTAIARRLSLIDKLIGRLGSAAIFVLRNIVYF